MGIERFGKNSLVGGLGSMLVIGLAILVLVILLVIMRLIASRSRLVMTLFIKLKRSMMYSSVLRYIL